MSAGDVSNYSGARKVTAPTGGYTKGLIYAIEEEYVVALETISAAAEGLVASIVDGKTYEVTKIDGTGESFAEGDQVYVNGNNKADPGATGNTKLNNVVADAVAAATDTTVVIRKGITADA